MSETIAFDKSELRNAIKAFNTLGDNSKEEAKRISNGLAEYTANKIKQAGYSRTKSASAIQRLVNGVKVSNTSVIGELKYGFASQRFSGGANTKQLWPGLEFGSKKYRQFPSYSGRTGRGGTGYFIYPTLRQEQPHIVAEWQKAFDKIIEDWADK
jgi:hypothetical protein